MASDAASHPGLSPHGLAGHDPTGSAERRDRARSVSSDLEAIFGQPRPAGAEPRARRMSAAQRRVEGEPAHRLSAASMGGLAAAALAGLAAGALLMKAPDKPASLARSHPAALPVEMIAPPQTPQAADAALAAAAPVPVAPAPTVSNASAPALHSGKPRRAGLGYAQVQAADRRLRGAYAAAIRAGAPRAVLVENRDRWASLRRRSADDPARLIAGYGDIARDLDRAAARSRGREIRASEPRSRFRPRFKAWW
jgi:hypothetical protein